LAISLDRPYSSLVAQFEANLEIPYPEDDSLLPRDEILGAIAKIEDDHAALIFDAVRRGAVGMVNSAQTAIAAQDVKAVKEVKSFSANAVNPIVMSLWQSAWKLGWEHALREVDILREGKFAASRDLALFKNKKKKLVKGKAAGPAQRNPRIIPLEDTALRAALEQRTVRVAQDLDSQTRDEIQQHLIAAADPKDPISRDELNARISDSLGQQRLREGAESAEGFGLAARSKRIAATEIMGGYSMARLAAFRSAGITRVRWQTFEPPVNVCEACWRRNGTIHDIDALLGAGSRFMVGNDQSPTRPGQLGYDPRQYLIPAHPFCRCLWEPVDDGDPRLADPGRDPRRRKPPLLRGIWATAIAGVIGIGALYLVMGRLGIGLNTVQQLGKKGLQKLGRGAELGLPVVEAVRGQTVDKQEVPEDSSEGVGSTVVNGIDLNTASHRVIARRLGLTPEQAQELRANILANPLQDVNELIERVRAGQLPSIGMDEINAKILANRPIGGSIDLGALLDAAAIASGTPGATASPYTPKMLVETLRTIQVPPQLARGIYRGFVKGGSYRSMDDLAKRLAKQGLELADRDRAVLEKYLNFTPSRLPEDWQRKRLDRRTMLPPSELELPDVITPGGPPSPVNIPSYALESSLIGDQDKWPFLSYKAPGADKKPLSSLAKVIDARIAEAYPPEGNRATGLEAPLVIRESRAQLSNQLARIDTIRKQIDYRTVQLNKFQDLLKKRGLAVEVKKDPSSGIIMSAQLVPVDPNSGITPARQDYRTLSWWMEYYNQRVPLANNLYEESMLAMKYDIDLTRAIAKAKATPPAPPDDLTGGTPVPRPTPPPPPGDTPAAAPPVEPPPQPTIPADAAPSVPQDPAVEAGLMAQEETFWALKRDELISTGQYNSSAAEYQAFNAEIKAAGKERMKAWIAQRKPERIEGPLIDAARRLFPKMEQREYREAAYHIRALEDALNRANSLDFVKAYSDAMLAKGKFDALLRDRHPEFAEYLEDRYGPRAALDRLARHFNVLGRTPYYEPEYFADYAGTKWYDVGKEIEDEWRRSFRLGEVAEMPAPTLPTRRRLEPETRSVTEVVEPEIDEPEVVDPDDAIAPPPTGPQTLPAASAKPTGSMSPDALTAPAAVMQTSALQLILREPVLAKTAVTNYPAQKRWAKAAGLIDARGNPTLEGALIQQLDPYFDSPVTGAIFLANMARQQDGTGWLLRQLNENPGGGIPDILAYDYNEDFEGRQINNAVKAINVIAKTLTGGAGTSPISQLRLFKRYASDGRIERISEGIANPYALAYGLAKVWEDNNWSSSELLQTLIDDGTFAAMFGLGSKANTDRDVVNSVLLQALLSLQVYGIVEVWLSVPPFQVVPRWNDLEDLIRMAYQYEEDQRSRRFQIHSNPNLAHFSINRRWRRRYA